MEVVSLFWFWVFDELLSVAVELPQPVKKALSATDSAIPVSVEFLFIG